jgi:hypothetical protein
MRVLFPRYVIFNLKLNIFAKLETEYTGINKNAACLINFSGNLLNNIKEHAKLSFPSIVQKSVRKI